jgi:hypothetical protein
VTTGIIDDLELVEIKKHKGVLARLMGQLVEGIPEASFKFATVNEICQGIVRCLPGKTSDKFPLGRLVVKNQDPRHCRPSAEVLR